MLKPVHLRDLLVETGSHPRGQRHVSSASGLVQAGGWLYAIADDEHHLALLKADARDEGVRLHRILAGDLPAEKARRKKLKPDLEALVLLPAQAGRVRGSLLALGSGSRPNREQGFLIELDGSGGLAGEARAVDLAGLYAPLRSTFADLNIEGSFVAGGRLQLLQRGNKGDGRNACIEYPLAEALDWLAHAGRPAPAPIRIVPFALGDATGIPLGFTDGAALPGGGWVFSAVAEDTADSYRDGTCAASAVGWVDAHGRLQRLDPIAGAPKVEGIAFAGDGRLLMVTDSDDPAVPSQLLALSELPAAPPDRPYR